MLLALTRPVPQRISECELTHLAREPISWERATRQHDEYEAALRALGCEVQRLDGEPDHPDSVFIEDTAVVLDECAVITRPGAASRRGETTGVAAALAPHRRLLHVAAPGTLDGGDVLRVNRHLYVGASTRSNADGAGQLANAIAPFGYTVKSVGVGNVLHLKTAVSALPDGRLLLDPAALDATSFDGIEWLSVHPDEPVGANVLVVGDAVLCPAAAPRTAEALAREGYRVATVDASELARAEGGLTCCSVLLDV